MQGKHTNPQHHCTYYHYYYGGGSFPQIWSNGRDVAPTKKAAHTHTPRIQTSKHILDPPPFLGSHKKGLGIGKTAVATLQIDLRGRNNVCPPNYHTLMIGSGAKEERDFSFI